jgi:proline dehydrogenase
MAILRSTFISLSQNQPLRRFSEASAAGRRVSSRFIAGMEIEEVLRATAALHREGLRATLDSLGENVHTPEEAHRSAGIYHRLLDAIGERGAAGVDGEREEANVSVKLTQMGMDLSPGLAEQIVAGLVEHASRVGTFVRVDMEGSAYTQATLDLVVRLHRQFPGKVGVVIQAYLRRSEADVAMLLHEGIRIRLCKGAYQEPAELAFPDKAEVDANYARLSGTLLASGIFHGLATHDPQMVTVIERLVQEQGIGKDSFEFQLLYGIRRDMQRALRQKGYGVRIYVPFGHEWYPYFMRRLAERPANVLFLMKNFFRA